MAIRHDVRVLPVDASGLLARALGRRQEVVRRVRLQRTCGAGVSALDLSRIDDDLLERAAKLQRSVMPPDVVRRHDDSRASGWNTGAWTQSI